MTSNVGTQEIDSIRSLTKEISGRRGRALLSFFLSRGWRIRNSTTAAVARVNECFAPDMVANDHYRLSPKKSSQRD